MALESVEKDYWPTVTDNQRLVLDELRRIYLDTGDWPTHAYLEQELERKGIDLDEELRGMPQQTFFPDNRQMGGVLYFQESDKVALMVRGLVACGEDAELEVEMLVAAIKWAVAERRAVQQQPHEVTAVSWRVSDALGAMTRAIQGVGVPAHVGDPPAYSVKLVFEVLRIEPTGDLPRWSGLPENFPNWQLDFPASVKRFRNVETIDDYLRETRPSEAPIIQLRTRRPLWPGPQPEAEDHHPVFGRITRRDNSFDCFVLLPLSEPFRSIYEQVVEPVSQELGITCGHAEGIFGPGRIMDDIVSAITHAEVIVAELTGKNPNVFYELGIAHQLGKQVVMMSQSMQDVPFDVRDRRVVVYHWSEMPDADEVKHRLRPHLEGALRAARDAV